MKRKLNKELLTLRVTTFCCPQAELTHWLCNVADITQALTPPKSHLTALKPSLQLCWQLKKSIDEHQSLVEHVLQKGAIPLQAHRIMPQC